MALTGHRDLERFYHYIAANTEGDKVRAMMETFDIEDALRAKKPSAHRLRPASA